ncbi:Glutamate formimidoyltransferase [Koleobacter methoxysyntrophicus]|uniref:glutamate formimidoyltransferase n=1 Tax=Koleobacter methoxysyntrophicus TaxID=2751313 RepID=A0A8A0RMU7_9FIRM|nr:glutamate formimidoyltransferase [Koleobacter methoxysyntrophicus]QSQ08918.1 Glutamate formimidoyltransferase [Koleobacter methoxysyntrophicus]
MSNKLLECVPNFSEGRNKEVIERIVDPFRKTEGVKLLDYSADKDHNRLVVTVIGDPEGLKKSVLEAMAVAVKEIDMNNHKGEHPRMGAVDVVPFIPVRNVTMEEAVELAKEVARQAAEKFNLPVYLYEDAATSPDRQNLASIRKGQFEGFKEKIKKPEWKPDFGPAEVHPTAGVTAVGARMPLVAFNVNLGTDNIEIADAIARKVRYIGGGLRYCKAIGVDLKERGIVQISMNMTNYTKTSLYQAYELIKVEARRYGVNVVGSELIGILPAQALIDVAVYYLGVENFSEEQILENRLLWG